MLKYFFRIGVFTFLFVSTVSGQYYQTNLFPYDITSGLPHNEINDIAKDKIGYVWIATENGLSRFDGYNFINFNNQSHPNIFKDNRIKQIEENGDLLYLLTEADGLIELNPKKIIFRRMYSSTPLSFSHSGDTCAILFTNGNLVTTIKGKKAPVLNFHVTPKDNLVIHKGFIYLSLGKKGIIRFRIGSPEKKTFIPVQGADKSGKLSISRRYGIIHHNGHVVRIIKNGVLIDHPSMVGKIQITFFKEEPSGKNMYIEKNKTLDVFFNDNNVSLSLGSDENYEHRMIFRVSENCLFVGTNQGIIKIDKNPALSSKINDFSFIKENIIVVRRSILEKGNKRYFLSYPYILSQDSTFHYITKNILPVADGVIAGSELYVVTDGNGLICINTHTNQITPHNFSGMSGDVSFEDISVFSDSVLLLSGGNKFVWYNRYTKKAKAHYLKQGTVIHDAYKSVRSDLIYLGTNKGLMSLSLKGNGVKNNVYYPETMHFEVRDILERKSSNELWLATNNGVLVLHSKSKKRIHSYSNEQEVSHPKVFQLVEDGNECVWASTCSGLTVYNTKSNTIRFLNKNHGIINTEFNYKSAIDLKNGDLIFGGLNSYEMIHPHALSEFIYATDFTISGIEISNNQNIHRFEAYSSGDPIAFQTGSESVKIYLSNFDYQFGGGYKFMYSLDSKNWYKIEKNNCLILTNLSYGEYNLKIRMYNPFGQLVKEKSFQLLAQVPLYEKTEFLFVVLILFILLGILFIRYFLRSIRIKSETRAQIAMDLHDESGTILTRLLLLSKRESFDSHEKERLHEGIKEALFSFRTYLDSITRKKHSIHSLSDELKEFIVMACTGTTIIPEMNIQLEQNYIIKSEVFRDIKLIIYESVTNSIKHSNATQLLVDMIIKNKTLHIVISDSGQCEKVNLELNKGNGIDNIKKRVMRNKGTLSIYVAEGHTGLTIDIKIPLK